MTVLPLPAGAETTITRPAAPMRPESARRETTPLLTQATEASAVQDRAASSTVPPLTSLCVNSKSFALADLD
jgi:hypothetical protein